MTKNLLKASLWGILTLSLFYSCRTDNVATEQTAQTKEKIAAFERFEKENNIIKPIASNDKNTTPVKYVSYSYPFALIIYNFLQTHPNYAKQIEKEVGTIRLDAVSQTFGNTEKSVIFPVTNNEGIVVGIWAGVINEERDYVNFYSLNKDTQGVSTITNAFQDYYDRKEKKIANGAIASIKGLNPIAKGQDPPKDPPVKAIEEVVITVPAPITDIIIPSGPGSPNYGTNPGGGMSGGPTTHGGAGNGTPSNPQKDPCKYPPMDNKPGSTSVKLPEGDNYFGFMHTHNNYDKNGNAPIKIFSPADIITFLTSCVRQADEKGSMSDAYAMVITSQGNYILKYSGDGSYSIGPNQIKNWRTSYEKIFNNLTPDELSDQSIIEKTFAQFLKDIVKVDGLEVYQSEKKTGATSKINADGTKNPC